MIEHPILFTGDMIRAILDGGKTSTMRPVKPQPGPECDSEALRQCLACPWSIGDRLWVRETWSGPDDPAHRRLVRYRADGERSGKWRPSVHMPRWASRVDLEITDISLLHVQEISEADAEAEGVGVAKRPDETWWQGYREFDGELHHTQYPRSDAPPDWMIEPKKMVVRDLLWRPATAHLRDLWDRLYAKRGLAWESNPWVWKAAFRRIRP